MHAVAPPAQWSIRDVNYPLIIMLVGTIALFVVFPIVFWIILSVISAFALYCLIQYDLIPLWHASVAECHRRARIVEIARRQPRRAYVFDSRPKTPVNWWHASGVLLWILGVLATTVAFWWAVIELVQWISSWF